MADPTFEQMVDAHYANLYRFAFGLTRSEGESCDLVQQTFYIWATKGHQLKEKSKAKTWLFTTLHREYLASVRRRVRFPQEPLSEELEVLPAFSDEAGMAIDAGAVLNALGSLDPVFRAPTVLYYLEDYSYQEVAEILEIPIGTVKSRLSRAIAWLHRELSAGLAEPQDSKGG